MLPESDVLEEDVWYTTEQVASIFQVTTETVRNWINNKELLAIKIGNQWRVHKKALVLFANKKFPQA